MLTQRIATARRSLAQAVSLGSGLWLALYGVSVLLATLIASRAIDLVVLVPPRDPIVIERPPKIADPQNDRARTLPPPVTPREGRFVTTEDEKALLPARDEPPTFVDPQARPGEGEPDPNARVSEDLVVVPTGEAIPPRDLWIARDQDPEPILQPTPTYPDLAIQAQVEGTVRVAVFVGVDGRVKRAVIDRSIPLLDQAAVAALERWTFQPALLEGRPVAVWVAIPVVFRLH